MKHLTPEQITELEPGVTMKELCIVAGKSRPTATKLVRNGELPGQMTSSGYVCPREWFERWQRGEWQGRQGPPMQRGQKQRKGLLVDISRKAS